MEIQGYKIYRKDGCSLRRGGGVAVLFREDLKHSSLININLTQDNDDVGILVERKDEKRIKIYSYYNPDRTLDFLINIEKFVTSQDELLIVGDFNGHRKLWSDKKPNKTGKSIEKIIEEGANLMV